MILIVEYPSFGLSLGSSSYFIMSSSSKSWTTFTSFVIHCSPRPCDSLESVKFQLYSHLPCTFLVYLVFLFCLFHISQYQKNHLLFVFKCTFFPLKESWCICLLFHLVFFKFLTHNLKWERLCCLLVISTFFFLSIS